MDAKEWAVQLRTEGDCGHERKMFGQIADAIDALLAENAKLKSKLATLTGYVCTCHTTNLDGWMERLLEHINASCEALNDPDRFRLVSAGRELVIIKREPAN